MNAARRFEALIVEHGAMVARICASYERDPELARELGQDVFLAVWRALPSFRGESSTRTFVARIAQFRAVSHVAARVRVPAGTSLDDAAVIAPGPLPDAQAIAANQRERLLEAVRRLPIAYRDAGDPHPRGLHAGRDRRRARRPRQRRLDSSHPRAHAAARLAAGGIMTRPTTTGAR